MAPKEASAFDESDDETTMVQKTLDGQPLENVFTKINCEEERWERFSQLSQDLQSLSWPYYLNFF